MKFKDTELLPGVVISANDPRKLGRIKVVVPGLFDNAKMSTEGMPWVYPLTMGGHQGFSKLDKGSKVWVFKQENNYKEFWYIPMFEASTNTRGLIDSYEDCDVLISRTAGPNSVQMYNSNEGVVIKNSDSSVSVGNSSVKMSGGGSSVSLENGKVVIGDGESAEEAVKGQKLKTTLENFSKDIHTLSEKAQDNPYTIHLCATLDTMAENLNNALEELLCKSTFIS